MILLIAASVAFAGPKANELVKITSASIEPSLKPGGASTLKVAAQVIDGWHINSDKPLSEDYIPTKLELNSPVTVAAGAVKYPPAQTLALEFAPGDKLAVFSGDIKLEVPLKAGADFAPKPGDVITVKIQYQGCNNTQCLRPASVSTTVPLATARIAGAIDGVGASGVRARGLRGDDRSGSALEHVFDRGWILGFIAVFLGGLALNLTPCVYPLIGVTIAYFGNQGGGPRRVLILAILFVLGIALMFSSVGVAVALSGGLFGAAMQNPFVLMALASILLMLAASSFGWFALQPPQWMMQSAGVARPGYAGAMLMGLGMGVVAAPCIGPIVLGLLLMVERSGSAFFGFALFFTLAIGLGVPYVGLALAAGSIRRLPRSGEWLAWIEQLFGFVLIGLAIYFLDPVAPNHLMTRLLPYYAAGAGIFLGFISPAGKSWRPFFVIRSALGIASVGALLMLLYPRPARESLRFEPFNVGLVASAAQQRKPVLIDFSADWCIPCREMENSTYIDPLVVREAHRFVRMKANLTAQDQANDAVINQFDIQGVPTTLLIDSAGKVRQRKVGYVGPRELFTALRQVN
ncbi:MAG: cytochrome c biogenesis protein CcdA [Candidatus Binatus sp.]|uniref:protein-disulfide reductase DsbD family protein n=1 Tax=Candidatus Binatus sp. TaxID=2811406 RepID=UPI00272857E3|nr:cytochrome c biogenesis protein CcdA [Candidatus Binatus sp.]MDO8432511.1 cytochrome c biogenesis protein CcdA [Candidatus Binatus sp.]